MEDKRIRVVKKFLQSKIWEYDGFIYEFIDVIEVEGYITFIVNVKTYKPNQSYVKDVLSQKIEEILESVSKYFGGNESTPFGGYGRRIYVNGRPSLEIYINGKKQEEILMALNNGAGKFDFEVNDKKYKDSFDFKKLEAYIKYSFSSTRFSVGGNDVSFFLTLNIYNLKLDNTYLKVSEDIFDDARYYMYDCFEYTDFYSDIADIIWTVVEPEIKLSSSPDMYITCSTKIEKINGFSYN